MNWIIITQLNEIYRNGKTRKISTLVKDPTIQYLLYNTKELLERGDYIVKGNGFEKYYETHLKVNYEYYHDFLVRNNLKKPQTRFEERDIQVLMDIENRMNTGDLLDLRRQIIDAHETVRGVSLMFFKHEKYLIGRPSLIDAIKHLLEIDHLADEKDQQYKYVLECENPRIIVLCENIDFLKRPHRPRQYNIELWYAGGNNISKLDYADTRGLAVYYSCDWDYDGLRIYESVKQKIPEIQLLYPTGTPKNIEMTEHMSHWKIEKNSNIVYGLNYSLFIEKEIRLFENLARNNEWIVEESNDLIKMVDNILFPYEKRIDASHA